MRFTGKAFTRTLRSMGGKNRAFRATLGAILTLASIAAYVQPAHATTTLISSWIKAKYPAQARATQTNSIAATKRWALLIGINNYASPTVDNVGSRQDAESMYFYLTKKRGWRADHIILMRDGDATAAHIIDGIRWLRAKTNGYSFVVFHYAGHENHTRTTADGDNETTDVEIWAANNRAARRRPGVRMDLRTPSACERSRPPRPTRCGCRRTGAGALWPRRRTAPG